MILILDVREVHVADSIPPGMKQGHGLSGQESNLTLWATPESWLAVRVTERWHRPRLVLLVGDAAGIPQLVHP